MRIKPSMLGTLSQKRIWVNQACSRTCSLRALLEHWLSHHGFSAALCHLKLRKVTPSQSSRASSWLEAHPGVTLGSSAGKERGSAEQAAGDQSKDCMIHWASGTKTSERQDIATGLAQVRMFLLGSF